MAVEVMRSLLAVLVAFPLSFPVLAELHATRLSTPRFDYAFDEADTPLTNQTDIANMTLTADADDTLVVCTVIGEIATPTISDNQDNVWETSITQSGSGHQITCGVKCDASAAAYTVEVNAPAGQVLIVTLMHEYSGNDTTSCVQNSAGGETASDTSPLTGATVTSSTAALAMGVAVSTAALTMTTGTNRSNDSFGGIQMFMGDHRLASATTGNAVWTFSGTVPSINIGIAIGEGAGGSPPSPLPALVAPRRGGGLVTRAR